MILRCVIASLLIGSVLCAPRYDVVWSGYDVVAYFSLAEWSDGVMGLDKYSAQLNGQTFLFSNADNQAKFKADPWKYAPRLGGY